MYYDIPVEVYVYVSDDEKSQLTKTKIYLIVRGLNTKTKRDARDRLFISELYSKALVAELSNSLSIEREMTYTGGVYLSHLKYLKFNSNYR